jgi:ribosomal RNA-processing protein 12
LILISNFPTASKAPTNQKDGKAKEKDRGFKTAPDGRLIIEDIEDQETDSDDDDMSGYQDKAKQEVYDEASDDEEGGPSSKKKVALNPYQAGGSGIHRPLAASVKSGHSRYSKSSKVSAVSRAPGSEYKSSKAGGDVKKKGKHEPYAYVALSRNSLNRRKRKGGSQFKNISKQSKGGKKGKGKN